MIHALSSEWLKLRSVRSTYSTIAAVAVAVLGAALLAWYAAHTFDGLSPAQRERFALSPLEPLIMLVAELCMAVLGVLAGTSEYATGMIRSSLVAQPRRRVVLAAKAGTVAPIALAVGLASVLGSSFLTRAIVGDRPIRAFAAPQSHEIALLLAQSLSVMVVALVSLGLGVVLRSTAGAIVCVVALLYVIPMFAQSIPAPWDERVNSIMLDALAGQLAGNGNPSSVYGSVLSPPAALTVMAAYVAVSLGVAAILITRRDA